jgi:hypothetical protein
MRLSQIRKTNSSRQAELVEAFLLGSTSFDRLNMTIATFGTPSFIKYLIGVAGNTY